MNRLYVFVCLLICSHAYALESPKELAIQDLLSLSLQDLLEINLVTIATGKQQSQFEAPATTTVITATDIEAIGATDLDEVLETIPGLHVSRAPTFNNPIYIMRGVSSAHNPEILMLINGIPVKQLCTGNRGNVWGGMPVNNIARIEVIRGASSAVYGANALSGVINIITKTKADINGSEFGVRTGSFDTQDVWALHGGNYAGFDIAASLEIHDTDGYQAIIDTDLQSQIDMQQGTSTSFAPASMNNERRNIDAHLDIAKQRWRMRAAYQGRDEIGAGIGAGGSLDTVGAYHNDRYNLDLTYHNPQVTRYWDVMVQTYIGENQLKPDPYLQIAPPNLVTEAGIIEDGYRLKASKKERNMGISLSSFYSGFDTHLLRLGTGLIYQDLYEVSHLQNFGIHPLTGLPLPPHSDFIDYSGTRYAFVTEGDRKNLYWFIQDEWKLAPDWTLTTSLRYDDYFDLDETWSPRLALVWRAASNLSLKALYGEAFRMSSFLELNHTAVNKNYSSAQQNPIRPEKMQHYELGVIYQLRPDIKTNLNVYQFRVKDMLTSFMPTDVIWLAAQNSEQHKGHGVELETHWKVNSQLTLLGNYAYQRVLNKQEQQVSHAPQEQIYIRADWQFIKAWYLNTQLNWVGERYRYASDPRNPVDDYTTVDVTVRHKGWNKHWDFAFSVRNLLNEERREPSSGLRDIATGFIAIPNDIPLAERSVYVEARYRY